MSPERLGPYETAMGGDAHGTVALYEWNLAVSAAMFETLGAVEVILRNAFHRQLVSRHADRGGTGNWYDSFGFWRYLVAKRYQTTAWPALQKAFLHHPVGPSAPRHDVEDRMQRIHVLRNRIAHHEPIFKRNLNHDHDDMLMLVGWISTEGRDWVGGISRVDALIAQRPH